jgi:hypothetical protein
VHVLEEHEDDRGWSYVLQVRSSAGCVQHHVTLCHRDHDYWTGGLCAPSATVERVVNYLLDLGLTNLPHHFDCSTARAWSRLHNRAIDSEMR